MTAVTRVSTGRSMRVERPSDADSHRWMLPVHLAVMALVAMAGLTAFALRLHEARENHDPIAVGCGLAVIGLIVYGRYALRLPWISASLVYLMLFWMFHYGLAFTAVVVPDVLTSMEDFAVSWMYRSSVRITLILGLIGAAGFMFGVVLMTAGRPVPPHVETVENAHDSGLYGVGWLIMLVGLVGTAVTLLVYGGLGVFSLGYLEFRQTVLSGTRLQQAVDLSQLGCLLALCGAGGRRWIAPLAVWSPLGVVMMLVGLRTEAMMPLITYAIVLTYRGIRLHTGVLVAAVVASLVIIPAVRVFRLVGFENRSLVSWTEVSPLETLLELGGTLQAAKAYVDFIEAGDEYLLGATYWAPFDRQILTRFLPDREQIPFDEDVRLPSRLVPVYEGAVGTSATGEAYYNFGSVGPFIYFACVGALFGWLERRAAASAYHCAMLGIVMGSLYFNIRSSWIAVPAQLGSGLAVLVVCYVIGRGARYSSHVAVRANDVP